MTFVDSRATTWNDRGATAKAAPYDPSTQAVYDAVHFDADIASRCGTGWISGGAVTATGGGGLHIDAMTVRLDGVEVNIPAADRTVAPNTEPFVRKDSVRVKADGTVYISQGTPGNPPALAELHRTAGIVDEVLVVEFPVPPNFDDIEQRFITPKGFPSLSSAVAAPVGECVNVMDYGADNTFDSLNGGDGSGSALNDPLTAHNLAVVAANDQAFADAIAAAKPLHGHICGPAGNYGISGGIIDFTDNDVGINFEHDNGAKTTLFHVSSTPNICVRQVMGNNYWRHAEDRDADTGPNTGLPAIPPILGITISGLYAAGGSIGFKVGNCVRARWGVTVQDYDKTTGENGIAAIGDGSVAVHWQNGRVRANPNTPAFDKQAWSEECVWDDTCAVRHNRHHFVIDGGDNDDHSSFGYNSFAGLFVQMFPDGDPSAANNGVTAHIFEFINDAWLYNTRELNITGNLSNGTFFFMDAGINDGNTFSGKVSIQIEGTKGDLTFFDIDKHSRWQSHGLIRALNFGAANFYIHNNIPNGHVIHHDGEINVPDMPGNEGWHATGPFTIDSGHATGDPHIWNLRGDWHRRYQEGMKLRWTENETTGTKKWNRVVDSTYNAGTDTTDVQLGTEAGSDTMDADPIRGSMRWAVEDPIDWPLAGSSSNAVIRDAINPVIGATTLQGDTGFGIGPTFRLMLRKPLGAAVDKDDPLGYFAWGGYYNSTQGHANAAAISAIGTAGWDSNSQPTKLRFEASPTGDTTSMDTIGEWSPARLEVNSKQGFQVKTLYHQTDDAGDFDMTALTGTPLNLRVVAMVDFPNPDDSAASGTSVQTPYSIGPRGRMNLEGQVYEATNNAITGQPPAWEHFLAYSDFPQARTIGDIANLTDGQDITVETTQGFDDSGTVSIFGHGTFSYTSKDATHFINVSGVTSGALDEGSLIYGPAVTHAGRSIIDGQGVLNTPLLMARGNTSFPTHNAWYAGASGTDGSNANTDAANYVGLFNNWHVGFYDSLGAFVLGPGTIDNMQLVSYTAQTAITAGIHILTRWGYYVEDVGGQTGGAGIGITHTIVGINAARQASALSGSNLVVVDGSSFSADGGTITIRVSATNSGTGALSVAKFTYGGKSGNTLTGVTFAGGNPDGWVVVGMVVSNGPIADEQIGFLAGKHVGGKGDTDLNPYGGALRNIGFMTAIGDAPNDSIQYGLYIKSRTDYSDVAASGIFSDNYQSTKIGIYNEGLLRQKGPTEFFGDVIFVEIPSGPFAFRPTIDFTHANVIGVTADITDQWHAESGSPSVTPTNTPFIGFVAVNDVPRVLLRRVNFGGANVTYNGAVAAGDPIASYEAWGQYDNTVGHYAQGGYILAEAPFDWSPTSFPLRWRFYTTAANTTTPALAFTIGSTGNCVVEGDLTVNGTITSGSGGFDITSITGELGAQHFGSNATGQTGVGIPLGAYFDWGNGVGSTALPLNTATFSASYYTAGTSHAVNYPGVYIDMTGKLFVHDPQPGNIGESGWNTWNGGISHRILDVTDRVNLDVFWVTNASGTYSNDNLSIVNCPGGSFNRHQIGLLFRDGHNANAQRSIYGLCFGMQANAAWEAGANAGPFWDGVLPVSPSLTGQTNGFTTRTAMNTRLDDTVGLWIAQMSTPGGGAGGVGSAGILATSGRWLTPTQNSGVCVGAFGDRYGTGIRWQSVGGTVPWVVFVLDGADAGAWQYQDFVSFGQASGFGRQGDLGTVTQAWRNVYAAKLDLTANNGRTWSNAAVNAGSRALPASPAAFASLTAVANFARTLVADLQNNGALK